MSAIIDISNYWDSKGNLNPEEAFSSVWEAIAHIGWKASLLPNRWSKFKDQVSQICDLIENTCFNEIGKKVTLDGKKCEIVAALPSGEYLVLAEELPVLRDRVHVRLGTTVAPDDLESAKPVDDITEYWRKDNVLRREASFLTDLDAIAHIRREAEAIRENAPLARKGQLAAIENTCLAVEHNYFQLIGNKVTINERKPDSTRGPLPTSGKFVAVLPEGRGLALSTTAANGVKYGFLVGRKRMAQIIRDMKGSK